MGQSEWDEYIQEARLLLMHRNKARARVCELAEKACNIQWGGGAHWNDFVDITTIARFATESGIHPKTLQNWLATYRYVYMKLPEKYRNSSFNWNAAQKCRRGIPESREETSPEVIEQLYLAESAPPKNVAVKKRVGFYCRSIAYNLKKLNSYDDLAEVEDMISEVMVMAIDKKSMAIDRER